MALLGDILKWVKLSRDERRAERADQRDERADDRLGKDELIQLLDAQIKNLSEALELTTDDGDRQALFERSRACRARKDAVLEAHIQFHSAMPVQESLRSATQLAPIIQTSSATSLQSTTNGLADEVFSLALTLAAEEQWLAGAYLFQRVQDLDPGDSTAVYNRAYCLDHADRLDDALAEYGRALEMAPGHPQTLNNRGNVFDKSKRFDEALADYNAALALYPNDAGLLNSRGVTLMHIGRLDDALTDFDTALRIDPNSREPPYNRACIFAARGKLAEALVELQTSIARKPSHRLLARTDPWFVTLRNDPRFKELVGEAAPPADDKPA